MATEREGGCVCGAIRFHTRGEPARVTICHCTWCQRRTGTAFGTEVVYLKENVVLSGTLSGIEPASYRHTSDESGRWLEIYFCPRCGTNLGFTLEAVPAVRTLPAGTFDDPTWITPDQIPFRHVYTCSRRPWSDLDAHVEVYEQHFRA